MALPDNVLASTKIIGYYLSPDDLESSPFIDFELGGIGLSDPSAGLQVQVWTANLVRDGVKERGDIFISAPNTPAVLFFSSSQLSHVALAFDHNMRPFVAYMEDGLAKHFWFDTNVAAYVTTTLPVGSTAPKCCMDDKRLSQVGVSDIILTYTRAGTLYYRQQRDRYTIERPLVSGLDPAAQVLSVGMNDKNRLQWVVGLEEYPEGEVNYRSTVEGLRRRTADGRARRLARLSYG